MGASTRSSSAEPEVRARYVGASFAAQAGIGLNDYFPWMLGADVFAGVRVTPSLSIEGFFASRFGASSTGLPVPCSGASDQWRAEVSDSASARSPIPPGVREVIAVVAERTTWGGRVRAGLTRSAARSSRLPWGGASMSPSTREGGHPSPSHRTCTCARNPPGG